MSNTAPPILRTNCPICAKTPGMKRSKHRNFWGHLREAHNMSQDQFRIDYPTVKVHEHEDDSAKRQTVRRTAYEPSSKTFVLTIDATDTGIESILKSPKQSPEAAKRIPRTQVRAQHQPQLTSRVLRQLNKAIKPSKRLHRFQEIMTRSVESLGKKVVIKI